MVSDTPSEEDGAPAEENVEPEDVRPHEPVRASSLWREMGTALLVMGGFVLAVGVASGGMDLGTAGWAGGALIVLGLAARWWARRSAVAGD